MMYCQDCVELLAEYIEGTLPDERKLELEEHLSYCPPCVAFIRTYKATTRVARQHLAANMPEEISIRLHEFITKKCRKGSQ